jgi:hypothetical protein
MWEWIIASAIAHRAVNRSGGARYALAFWLLGLRRFASPRRRLGVRAVSVAEGCVGRA